MLKRIALVLVCLLCPVFAQATTTVSGTVNNLGTGAPSYAFVRFWLFGCGGNQPRVNGTAIIAPSIGGVFYFDIVANASGTVSGTIYSTRDNTGNGNGDIECGGSRLAAFYGMQVFSGGNGGPVINIQAKSGTTLDPSNVTPLTTLPVVTAPTGDSTYARLDAGNQPFTGNISAPGVVKVLFVDGATYTTPQAAIAACPSTDCWVMVPPGSYAMPTNLRSHLHVTGYNPGIPAATISAANSVLVWGTPPADQKVIFTSSTGTTLSGIWDFTIEGVTLDCGGNNVNCLVLQNGIFSNQFGTPSAPLVIQNSGTGTALTLNGGSVSGQSVVANDFSLFIFNAGEAIKLTATSPGVSANNRFHTVHAHNITSKAIEFVQQADSNRFEWTFISGLANAANGIMFNTGTPGSDVDVDGNIFTHCLCADVANGGSYTGTIVTVNNSHGNAILDWELGGGIQSGGGVELSNPNNYTFTFQITADFNASVNEGGVAVKFIKNFNNTATMSLALKKGTGAGNYTTASTTYVVVDSTNLCNTVTIPTGWKLGIQVSGNLGTNTAAVLANAAITDNATCSTANAGVLAENSMQGPVAGTGAPFSLSWVINGDGNAHNIALQFKTSNGADAATLGNSSATYLPTMVFTLMPSN